MEVPEGAMTLGVNVTTEIWGFLNILHVLLGAPIIIVIVIHSNKILKSAATSARTIAMHKEAIRSLVIQVRF